MTFYSVRDTVCMQAQAAGFSLQIGHRIWGWFGKAWANDRGGDFMPTRLIIAAPQSCGIRVLFQAVILGVGISYISQRPGTSSWTHPGPGLRGVWTWSPPVRR
jgi:hypothetical protein